jgi:hypothetical protein
MNRIILLVSLFVCICLSAQNRKEYKLIPLRNVDYEVVDRVCRPWLGKGEILVHEKARKSILVYAEPETVVKILKFLDNAAEPEVNIRIDIDKRGSGSSSTDRIAYRYRKPVPVVTYKNGKKTVTYTKPGGAGKNPLVLQSRRSVSNSNSLQFIITQSGSPASLWVGKTVVDPSWLRNMLPKKKMTVEPNGYTITTDPPDMGSKMVNVGVSLKVLPRYLKNNLIEVEVYPEITQIVGKGKWKNLKVTSLATKVIVKNGAKVYIGGVVNQKNDEYKNLFGPDFFTRKGVSEVMDMYITATVLKPGESGRRSPLPLQ